MERSPASSRPDADDAREARVEQFVGRAAHSHFMQARAWLDAFTAGRERVERVVTTGSGDDVRGCSSVRRVRGRAFTGEKCFVDGGPVFDSVSQLEPHIADLVRATQGASYLRIRPYLFSDETARLKEMLADYSFRPLPPERQSGYAATLVLDLSQSPEKLYAGFSVGLRRNLRRTARSEIRIGRVFDGPLIAEFAAVLVRAAAVAGYDVPPKEAISSYLERVCHGGSATGALFCASSQGRVRAGIVVLRAGSSAVYHWGARSDPLASGDAPLAHALHWEAINWAREQGFRHYDFGGLSDGPALAGIDRFKQAFGGERQRMFGEAIRTRGLLAKVIGADPSSIVSRLRFAGLRNSARVGRHAERA